MTIIPWDASYFRHWNNIHTARALLQKFLMELQQVLFMSKSYLCGKEQKWMSLGVSWSNQRYYIGIRRGHWLWFCAPVFLHPLSGAQLYLRTRSGKQKKNRARRSQFVQPCCEPLERSCKSEPLVNCKVISSETNELYYFQPNIFWRISENISKRLSKV